MMEASKTEAAVAPPADAPPMLPSSGEGENEMQAFVQHHLLSLLRPLNEHIQDLEDQVNNLRRNLLERCVRIDSNLQRIQQHEDHLVSCRDDIAQANARATRIHADLSQMFELGAKSTKDRFEAIRDQSKDHFESLGARVLELESFRASAEASVEQFHHARVEMSDSVAGVVEEQVACRNTLEELRFGNLGFSQRLEQAKRQGDETTREHQKLAAAVTKICEEVKLNHERCMRRFPAIEEKVNKQAAVDEAQDAEFQAMQQSVQNLHSSVFSIEENMSIQDRDMQAQISELGASEAAKKSAIDICFDRLDETAAAIKAARDFSQEQRDAMRKELLDEIDADRRNIQENVSDIRSLEGTQTRLGNQLQATGKRLAEETAVRADLGKEVQSTILDVRDLTLQQQKFAGTLDLQAQELDKAHSRLWRCERGLEQTNTNVRCVSTDLTATRDDVAMNGSRLNLAHDYLKGLTRGFQDAHHRVVEGLDGMLQHRDRDKAVCLPVLPGSQTASPVRPGPRPATSMT